MAALSDRSDRAASPALDAADAMRIPALAAIAAGTVLVTAGVIAQPFIGDGSAGPGQVLAELLFAAGSAICVAAAVWSRRLPAPGRRPAYVIAAAVAVCAALSVVLTVVLLAMGSRAPLGSDGALFDRFNASLVLKGINPYTAGDRFWTAIRQDPGAGATPVERGIYRGRTRAPSLPEVVQEVRREAADPTLRGPQFDPASLHSYPALAFLVLVPAAAVHDRSLVVTAVALLVPFLLAAGWGCPRRLRSAVALILVANAALVLKSELGAFEFAALLGVVLAWRLLDRRLASPLLLGLGCAVKQIAWPAVPFYLVLVARRDGWREAARRLGLAATAFLLPNLPFVLAAPAAWARSMLLPISLPTFPTGVGIVWPSAAGLLPLAPSGVYGLAEAVAFAALLAWWARSPRALVQPRLGPLLALLPLALAWRSIDSYFLALPALAMFAAVPSLPRPRPPIPRSSPVRREIASLPITR